MVENSFSWVQERGRNFVPSWEMVRYAKANPARWECYTSHFFETVLKRRDGREFIFDRFDIKPLDDLTELVTIYLTEALNK